MDESIVEKIHRLLNNHLLYLTNVIMAVEQILTPG